MKKASFLLFALLCMVATDINAQTYRTALGAKFYAGDGSAGGINIRHSSSAHNALEGTLLFLNDGLGIEGLYQYQGPVTGAQGLSYFVGGGGMLGFGSGRHDDNGATFALRLTGGIDYKFVDAPINVSLGLDPFFYLAPAGWSNLSLGIGLRYVIK